MRYKASAHLAVGPTGARVFHVRVTAGKTVFSASGKLPEILEELGALLVLHGTSKKTLDRLLDMTRVSILSLGESIEQELADEEAFASRLRAAGWTYSPTQGFQLPLRGSLAIALEWRMGFSGGPRCIGALTTHSGHVAIASARGLRDCYYALIPIMRAIGTAAGALDLLES